MANYHREEMKTTTASKVEIFVGQGSRQRGSKTRAEDQNLEIGMERKNSGKFLSSNFAFRLASPRKVIWIMFTGMVFVMLSSIASFLANQTETNRMIGFESGGGALLNIGWCLHDCEKPRESGRD